MCKYKCKGGVYCLGRCRGLQDGVQHGVWAGQGGQGSQDDQGGQGGQGGIDEVTKVSSVALAGGGVLV